MVMKISSCLACGSNKLSEVVVLDNSKKDCYLQFSKIKYNHYLDDWPNIINVCVIKCNKCGHHMYKEQPSPDMLSGMYENGLALVSDTSSAKKRNNLKSLKEMKKLKKLIKSSSPKLLDYGSGFGVWAKSASSIGFIVTAYEPSMERSSNDDSSQYDLVNSTSELEGRVFDVINLEQVLEHVPDPYELLLGLKKYCNKNTILRISVPNILRCPEGNNIWNDWPYDGRRVHTMAPFEHLHGFTPHSLKRVTALAGFAPVNSLATWIQYPKEKIRHLLHKILPKFGQTFLLLKLKG